MLKLQQEKTGTVPRNVVMDYGMVHNAMNCNVYVRILFIRNRVHYNSRECLLCLLPLILYIL